MKLTWDQRKVYDDTLLADDNRGREVKFEGQEVEDPARSVSSQMPWHTPERLWRAP